MDFDNGGESAIVLHSKCLLFLKIDPPTTFWPDFSSWCSPRNVFIQSRAKVALQVVLCQSDSWFHQLCQNITSGLFTFWFKSPVGQVNFLRFCLSVLHAKLILQLELVCCKKWPKIVPDQLLVWGIRALKVLNGTKLILDVHGNNLDSFRIPFESFRSFRGSILLKPVTGQELFFVVSYSKDIN